jgi:antitoxin component of RelBE/YafQ-DinJ toxin-antitoxin module
MSTPSTSDVTLLNQEEPAPPVEASVVPETYADFKLPEGAVIDPELLAEATPIFKELGLTQDAAQKLVDFYAKTNSAGIEKLFNDQRAVRQEWATEAKTYLDALPGGIKQAKADLGAAKNALFANPDGTPNTDKIGKFNQFMDMTGAGDNPLFIEAFTKMAKLYTEGKPVTGGGPSKFGQTGPGSRPTAAGALYPNLTGQP